VRTHIDWLTFTMTPRYNTFTQGEMSVADAYGDAIEQAFVQTFGRELVEKAFGGKWEKQEKARAPYTDAWNMKDCGITLFAGVHLTHCCVEISGIGCERLITLDCLSEVLGASHERTTRIDIASDIETETRPKEFVAKVNHERMRASGYQNSDSGETCYVGSQKSDRYARVYRYNSPHPRAHLLRIEHVFRREYAKVVAKQCLSNDVAEIAGAAGLAFGWAHKDWQPSISDSADISIVSAKREDGKTLYWLVNSVAPAFKRLCETGGITNPEEFLARYFLPAE